MIRPENVTTPEYAGYCIDETRAGTALCFVGSIALGSAGVYLNSAIESTALGVAAGLSLYKGIDFLMQSFAYTRRARELWAAEEI